MCVCVCVCARVYDCFCVCVFPFSHGTITCVNNAITLLEFYFLAPLCSISWEWTGGPNLYFCHFEFGFSISANERVKCQRGGETYSIGAVWKENCNRTTCECTIFGARCEEKACGAFLCSPGFVYGPPDACGCPGRCVRKNNTLPTFLFPFSRLNINYADVYFTVCLYHYLRV